MTRTLTFALVACLPWLTTLGAYAGPLDEMLQANMPAPANWAPVRQIEPGREILVTVTGSPAGTRYFVSADDTAVIVLDLTDPGLSDHVRDVLRDIARQHPEYFEAALGGPERFGMQDVQIAQSGIYLVNEKVADVERVVRRIERAELVRIESKGDSSVLSRGLLGGIGLAALCTGGRWVGVAVCGSLGGALGFASGRKADEVIYPYQAVLPGPAAVTARPVSPGTTSAIDFRVSPARRLMRADAGRVKETMGMLTSDTSSRTIRFDVNGRTVFVVPYERITALHYEQGLYPQRFLKRPSYYFTIHYSDSTGRPAFETIRLLSAGEVLPALDGLERATGHTVDRALTTRSFLGIPIRARVGAKVAVTDQAGQSIKGTIAELSSSSLALDTPSGAMRVFEAAEVQRIRLLYSPKHDALVGLSVGGGLGALMTLQAAGLGGCFSATRTSDCHVARVMGEVAAVTGGLGAVMGMTIGAARYPRNKAFDVYLGEARDRSGTAALTLVPLVTQARKGVVGAVRF